MSFDRETTLKKAEKLLRQGRLEAAITEYVRVVEDQPNDWNTANTLGDLYARASQQGKAIAQYSRIAEHFVREGFYPKAAALYKKILKINPQDEGTQLQLAEVSALQGLLADAKAQMNAVAARRRSRGDRRGASEIVIRLGALDPADFDARRLAARTLEEMGDREEAAARLKTLYEDLVEKGRTDEALESLRESVRLAPADPQARASLAKAALARGDAAGAREFLDGESAGNDPDLLLALAEVALQSGSEDRARELLPKALAGGASRSRVLEIGWSLLPSSPEAAFSCIDCAVDAAAAASAFDEAAGALQEFVARVPGQIPALLKLVEVCVDGGLEAAMYKAQEQLTDAYLDAGQAAEARVIAEDLVAREPWESAHLERFRRALVMLRVSDPDTVIAERLSGQAPFLATDPFIEAPPAPAPPIDAPAPGEIAGAEHTQESPAAERAPAVQAPTAARTKPTPPTTAAPAASQEEADIDLTGALGGLDSAAQPATAEAGSPKLDGVFARLRADAAETGDYAAQHMTLARTYLEMGMTEEAMSSLAAAARSVEQRFEASTLLARLHQQHGDTGRAIEWMERAAEAAAPDKDSARALLYELGVALEGTGEIARALAVFLELQAEAGDYRDVPSRIDRLSRVQTGG